MRPRVRTAGQLALCFLVSTAVALFVISLMPPIVPRAAADESAAGRREMQKAIVALRPRQSLDIYPVEFSVGGIHYRVPRNYLTTMDNWSGGPQGLVTLTVNFPDLKPLSKETAECFGARLSDRPAGCEPLSFIINGPRGPSADQAFANMKHLFHSQVPIRAPFGFEKYEIGPEDARIEYYRKNDSGHTDVYSCQIFDNHGKRDGICDPFSDHVSTGGVIHFYFKSSPPR